MTSLIYIGVDGEMTSDDFFDGGRLCQIGVAKNTDEWFVHDLRCPPGTTYKPTSMAVHGLPKEYLRDQATPASEVDDNLYSFLQAIGGNIEKKILVPIGFNVAAFDMPFIKFALPKSYSLFSRRMIDLNAVVLTMGDMISYGGSVPTWKGFKRLSKRYAGQELSKSGIEIHQHNAGYDALEALYAWWFLRDIIRYGNDSPRKILD